MMRMMLYEAAQSMLVRSTKWSGSRPDELVSRHPWAMAAITRSSSTALPRLVENLPDFICSPSATDVSALDSADSWVSVTPKLSRASSAKRRRALELPRRVALWLHRGRSCWRMASRPISWLISSAPGW